MRLYHATRTHIRTAPSNGTPHLHQRMPENIRRACVTTAKQMTYHIATYYTRVHVVRTDTYSYDNKPVIVDCKYNSEFLPRTAQQYQASPPADRIPNIHKQPAKHCADFQALIDRSAPPVDRPFGPFLMPNIDLRTHYVIRLRDFGAPSARVGFGWAICPANKSH